MNSNSFGLWANPTNSGAFIDAIRVFSNSLSIGQTFTFKWAINWDSAGGNKGFSLSAGSTEVINVNNGSSQDITLNGNNVNFGYGTNAMTWSFTRTATNSVRVVANDRDGNGTYSNNLTVVNGAIDRIKFYAAGLSNDNGGNREPYFNDFLITSTTADVTPPEINLAAGVDKVTWVAKDGTINLSNADVTATDSSGTANVTFSPATVNTASDGITTVTYTATDSSSNTATVTRLIVVGDAAPGWRKLQGPSTNTISTTGSATIYGRIFIDGATPGAGQAPNITAELGVNSANTDPATWAAGAWKTANHNSGFNDGDDEYQATINGADLSAGTYFYAYRFKIGNGSWFYAGMNAAGTDGGPWDGTTNLSGTLVVSPAQVRDVTFALDMRVQQFKNAFVSGEKVVVSGAFNGWGTNNELTLDSGSGLHKATINIDGLEGTTNEFKFRILGTTRTNAGMEYESVSNRALVLGAAGVATNLPTAFFNNLEESRKITFRVDMSVQAAKGSFNTNTGTVSVAGSFNGWGAAVPLSAQGSGVYAAEVMVDGPLSAVEYKFVNGTTYEDPMSNRTITAVLPNLQASTLDTVYFLNDDGVAPTDIALSASSIAENNAVNATVGTLSSTDATVGDTHTYSLVTGSGDTDNASFNISGTSLRAGAAFDFETKASYSVRVRSTDVAGNFFEKGFTITVTDVSETPAGSTFAGWSGGATLNSANVGKYAIGGASSLSATDGVAPTSTVSGGNLVLTAIVRVDDPKLTVVGEAVGSLTDYGTPASITSVTGSAAGIDQTGVPTGFQKQAFTVPQGSDARKFLRLKGTLAQ